jgi:hypothetical protein
MTRTPRYQVTPGLRHLLTCVQRLTREETRAEIDAKSRTQWARRLDRFARELTDMGQDCRTGAALCRLIADRLRGVDVPDWIYPEKDEDPADTARWQKWRVS